MEKSISTMKDAKIHRNFTVHPCFTSRNISLLFGGIGICLGMLTCPLFYLGGKNDVNFSTPQVNGNIQQSQMAIHLLENE
jgi:hypothetical protein